MEEIRLNKPPLIVFKTDHDCRNHQREEVPVEGIFDPSYELQCGRDIRSKYVLLDHKEELH